MEIAQDRDRDSDQDRIRESNRIPETAPTNLPAALPLDLKDDLSNPLIIDFEATPDGGVFQIGAVFNDLVFNEKNISNHTNIISCFFDFSFRFYLEIRSGSTYCC